MKTEETFRLLRHEGVAGALRSGAPWFLTLGLLAVVNVGASSFIDANPEAIPWMAGLSLLIVLGGLFVTFRRAWAPKPRFGLHVGRIQLRLLDPAGVELWSTPVSALTVTPEVYVFRSRYGTYRQRMFRLAGKGTLSELRVVCYESLAAESEGAPGGRPDYVVDAADFGRLQLALEARTR